jgi:hypothetical protein
MVHIDPFGTIMVPLVSMTTGFAIFGWARPVPVNEASFRDKTWNVVVSLAGPFSNLLLIIFGCLLFSLAMRIAFSATRPNGGRSHLACSMPSSTSSSSTCCSTGCLCSSTSCPSRRSMVLMSSITYVIRGRGWLYEAWDVYARIGLLFLLMLFWFSPLRFYFSVLLIWLTENTLYLLGVPPFSMIGLR